MKNLVEMQIDCLEPALDNLKEWDLWRVKAAVAAQAIRLGLCRAMIVAAPDDLPNCFVNFWDEYFGDHVCYHLDIVTFKLILAKDIKLPEPTRQPDDPVVVPCANGRNCNC